MNPHALEIRDLRMSRDKRPILRGVSLDVAPGTICALMGRSGAGKSTILRCAAALEPFDSGTIGLGGTRLEAGALAPERSLRDWRRAVGMVFQSHALFEHLTALENVALAPVHARGVARAEAAHQAHRLLESLGVGHRSDALPRALSGGEAQRVAIARALALDPSILLMDEPTAALDPARRGSLAESLSALASQGRGLLIATHDVEFALSCATDAVILADGVVVEHGDPRTMLLSPSSTAARELLRTST